MKHGRESHPRFTPKYISVQVSQNKHSRGFVVSINTAKNRYFFHLPSRGAPFLSLEKKQQPITHGRKGQKVFGLIE